MLTTMACATHYVNKKVDEIKGSVIYARRKARYAPSHTAYPQARPPLTILRYLQTSEYALPGRASTNGKGARAPLRRRTRPARTGAIVDWWGYRVRHYPHARAATGSGGGGARCGKAVRRLSEAQERCGHRRCEQRRGAAARRQARVEALRAYRYTGDVTVSGLSVGMCVGRRQKEVCDVRTFDRCCNSI